jgi:uncharacterized protein (TIGR03435 family)
MGGRRHGRDGNAVISPAHQSSQYPMHDANDQNHLVLRPRKIAKEDVHYRDDSANHAQTKPPQYPTMNSNVNMAHKINPQQVGRVPRPSGCYSPDCTSERHTMHQVAAFLVFTVNLDAQPAFEVASIKLHVQGHPPFQPGISVSGNRVVVNALTLRGLVKEAYNVEYFQIMGGPKWADDYTAAYDIAAVAPSDTPPAKDQIHKMLQALLAARFQLELRHETRDLPVYEKVIAKRGPKLKESAADAVFANRQGGPGQSIHMTAVHNAMAQLANIISVYAGRPVLDKTGLTKTYDFTMDFTSEGPRGPAAPPSADQASPSIFTALEEQLGLKLEPQKRPTEILIIDRAERPSEN